VLVLMLPSLFDFQLCCSVASPPQATRSQTRVQINMKKLTLLTVEIRVDSSGVIGSEMRVVIDRAA
jgi:hypothetical protein